jgi:hypothetical protein
MAEINLGVLLTLDNNDSYRFQNYKVGTDVTFEGADYQFAPFSFTGAISNLQGDNLDAGLVFVCNAVTRAWAETAVDSGWVGVVKVMLLKEDSSIEKVLYQYTGKIASGGWDDTQIELSLNTVMDSVRGTVPGRRMNHQLVGDIPITAAINV